jgi:hypothetical protein
MLSTTTLGAALLGLSGVFLAVDIGGNVALDAGNAAATRAPDPANPARAVPAAPVVASIGSIAPQRPAIRAAAPRQYADAPAQIRPAPKRAQTPPVRAQTLPVRAPAHQQSTPPPAPIRTPPPIRRPDSGPAKHAAVPHAPAAVARKTPSAAAIPAAAPVLSDATLREVRHYAMKRLTKKYPALRVISADTYAVAGGCVRVQMVVRNGTRRWIEKDTVRRKGTDLALLASAQHDMPYPVAPATPAPTEDEGP